MSARNLADPAYEPSDEDLAELMHKAFAEVGARNAASLAKLRVEIEAARAEALRVWAKAHP